VMRGPFRAKHTNNSKYMFIEDLSKGRQYNFLLEIKKYMCVSSLLLADLYYKVKIKGKILNRG
jgi:hypothetical protein